MAVESLFNGEFVVKQDGIYTFVHYYTHPETELQVVLAGMNHGGDKKYFDRIGKILNKQDKVIFEAISSDDRPREEKRQEEEKELQNVYSADPNEAFFPAVGVYFQKTDQYLNLVCEEDAFDFTNPNWVCGDMEFFMSLENKDRQLALEEEMQKKLNYIPTERKKEVVEYIKRSFGKIESKQFTKRDFGESFVFLYSDPNIVKLFSEILCTEREEMIMNCFDKIVVEDNPRSIGLKYGAAHIPNLRSLCEQRGYLLNRSTEFRNLKF
ncbi:hypothetical protein HYW46_06695 [Candidatus Daviesbacteria bacterium]|nr:hypothetical protein [Candidatus Daviesbacteria bacterium]